MAYICSMKRTRIQGGWALQGSHPHPALAFVLADPDTDFVFEADDGGFIVYLKNGQSAPLVVLPIAGGTAPLDGGEEGQAHG